MTTTIVPILGEISLHIKEGSNHWYCSSQNLIDGLSIDVTIRTWNDRIPIKEQIDILQALPLNYTQLMSLFLGRIQEGLSNTDLMKSVEDLQTMYYLSAIDIWPNGTQVDYTLEPAIHVPSRYNFFQRFRVIEGRIVLFTPN